MSFPPLQPISKFETYVSGDVTVDPSAAIAPGVLLQADPGSRIVIASGVCIGMGAILHASQGDLIVKEGATLGAGVLIVGKSTIGANACIGAVTTILNCDVEQEQAIASGSLMGDRSRAVTQVQVSDVNGSVAVERNQIANQPAQAELAVAEAATAQSVSTPPVVFTPQINEPATQSSINSAVARNAIANIPFSPINPQLDLSLPPVTQTANSNSSKPTAQPPDLESEETPKSNKIYGQEHLNRLRGTLFPQSQPSLNDSNQSPSEGQS